MHTVIFHGGAKAESGLEDIHTLLCEALRARGASVESIRLEELRIHPCVGCFNCWVKTPGECMIDDDGRRCARASVQTDMRILLTPITFGGYSGVAKLAFDRMVPTISPLFEKVHGEMHHRLRYAQPARLAVIGWQREPDEESADIFRQLVQRNAINMHSPAHGALVLTAKQDAETQRMCITDLLRQVEVG